ncbi:hypothetical protein KC19_VG117000 [Ceratodon purpureus]|uniref:Secreted protein n=1 Tax=Ceratodon purpureus TaxID=3225 RepID=A0A8T0HP76_CERPU|nr:hypothetical protein KC19_VG117000 [Ceratodon purpureus]
MMQSQQLLLMNLAQLTLQADLCPHLLLFCCPLAQPPLSQPQTEVSSCSHPWQPSEMVVQRLAANHIGATLL